LRAGEKTEKRALAHLENRGFKLLKVNLKISGVQIDLLMRDPSGVLCVIEVKSEGAFLFGVLSSGQKKRLKRAQLCLSSQEPTRLLVLIQSGAEFEEIWIED
jgi:Holliday junction resolvase-like predicted endonuclease